MGSGKQGNQMKYRNKNSKNRMKQSKISRENKWDTLGPAGPPLHMGVLLVLQSLQDFFI